MHTADAFAWVKGAPAVELFGTQQRETMREIMRELSQLIVAVVAMVAVVLMAIQDVVDGAVAVGFMGTVVGYIFGRSVGSVQTARAVERINNQNHD